MSKNKRKRQRLFRYAVDTFIDLLEQVTKRRVDYKCNNADTGCWDGFMDNFGDNIGEEFVRTYTMYGIQSWFNDGSEVDYSRRVRFSWLFGKKAIKRWYAFDMKTNVRITQKSLKQNHVIKAIPLNNRVAKMISEVRFVEENFKAEYHNTNRGFLWCVANTTLYHHKSKYCVTCKFKQDCKKLLEQEFEKVYLKRGYGG